MSFEYHLMKWLGLAIHLAGLAICVLAYRRSQKCGYLIIGGFYLFAVFSLTFAPAVNRAIRDYQATQTQDVLSSDTQKQYSQELATLDAKYFPTGRGIEIRISYPVGPLVLLCGIWILARRESKDGAEPNPPPNRRLV